jgi:hypothetical protein
MNIYSMDKKNEECVEICNRVKNSLGASMDMHRISAIAKR